MKKRIVLLLALAALIGGGVFAQTHFVSADVSLLGGGLRYEYVITPYVTIGAYAYYNYLPFTPFVDKYESEYHSVVNAGIATRLYPAGRRFFIELGLGYGYYTNFRIQEAENHSGYSNGQYYNYTDPEHPDSKSWSSFSVVPGFGWTIDVGRAGGFFISPSIKVPITITDDPGAGIAHSGILPSGVVSLGFGYAFF
ncbi:hypothetical protein LQZ19_10455 [Treponema primitia]|uniref:hypothetical protein n=1 Tax=Treponema primitia TaxID=88058 RepID=UPI0039803751